MAQSGAALVTPPDEERLRLIIREELSIGVRAGVRAEFRDIGFFINDDDDVREARGAVSFLFRLHRRTKSLSGYVGQIIVYGILAAIGAVLLLGVKSGIGK